MYKPKGRGFKADGVTEFVYQFASSFQPQLPWGLLGPEQKYQKQK
jgi:hypothetical protein